MLKRELENARRELGNLKTEQHENTVVSHGEAMTVNEKLICERSGHALLDLRCEICVKVRGTFRHPRGAAPEAVFVDDATVKNSREHPEVEIMVGAGPRGRDVRDGCAPQRCAH